MQETSKVKPVIPSRCGKPAYDNLMLMYGSLMPVFREQSMFEKIAIEQKAYQEMAEKPVTPWVPRDWGAS